MTKQEILAQLKKQGVTSLSSFADLVVKHSNPAGDPGKPPTNTVIIYKHGFVKY